MKKETKNVVNKKANTKTEGIKKPKLTKTSLITKHLIEKKHITSWDAITLYKATRLSAIIFILRKKYGYDIATKDISIKDSFGNDCTFAKYILVSTPKKKQQS